MGMACIIHGAYGSPNENWFPWLKENLEARGHIVILPRFPTPEDQTLNNWLKVIRPYIGEFNNQTILIGHSLGPAFIAHILAKYDVSVRAALMVAGFRALLSNPDFDTINSTFVTGHLAFGVVRSRCEEFIAYISDNDPYVPRHVAEDFATSLGAEVVVVPGAGHFNSAAGYSTFPDLCERCAVLLEGT